MAKHPGGRSPGFYSWAAFLLDLHAWLTRCCWSGCRMRPICRWHSLTFNSQQPRCSSNKHAAGCEWHHQMAWWLAVASQRFENVCNGDYAEYSTPSQTWPAMRVISLGIRTVPILSVAKKLAAPRPTPTALAAKCGLIRQDEADWLWLSIGCWKTFALLFFSSLLEVIKADVLCEKNAWHGSRGQWWVRSTIGVGCYQAS